MLPGGKFGVSVPPTDPKHPYFIINQCYVQAAFNSAAQMMRERNKRRAASGLPPLVVLPDYRQIHNASLDPSIRKEDLQPYYLGRTDTNWGTTWPWPWDYEGDYSLSLRQFRADDEAERAGRPFTLLKSPDGISPFSPSRLAQVALEDNFAALRSQEAETVRLLSQTLSPSQVAEISSSQSTTDPIGRILLGALSQNAAHAAELGAPEPAVAIGSPHPPAGGQPAGATATQPPAMTATSGTDAQRLGVVPPMGTQPVAIAGIVEDAGGGSPVLFWALAIGGLIYSLSTGKKTVRVF